MTVWIACGAEFIVADVIRWREAVWDRRGPKGARPKKIGDRDVVAEVIEDADGYVLLLVRSCVLGKDTRPSDDLKPGSEVRRKASTIARGNAERLEWNDETARQSVRGSKFMRSPAVSHAASATREN